MAKSSLSLQFERSALSACRAQFPRACTICKTAFPTFLSYVEKTQRIGAPKLDTGDDPLGLLVFANCGCGNTSAVCYEDVVGHVAFNEAVRSECTSSRRSEQMVLNDLVDGIHQLAKDDEALVEAAPLSSRIPDPMLLEIGAAMMKAIVSNSMAIPVYPAVAFKLEQLARQADVGLDEIAHVISGDAALAAAVVQLANSALHAAAQPITSVQIAVSRLGAREIARLAIAAGLGATTTRVGPLRSLRSHLWHQSLTTATISFHLGRHRGLAASEAFLAGLLFPLGSIMGALSLEALLAKHPHFPPQPLSSWMQVIEHFRPELGSLMAARWKLPRMLREVIDFHALQRSDLEAPELMDVVLAANAVARVAAEVSEVTSTHLAVVTLLRSAIEREFLLRVLPTCGESISSFEDARSARPSTSMVSGRALPTGALATEVWLVNTKSRADRYRAVAFARSVVVEGKKPLAENFLACLEAEGEKELQLWATAKSCVDVNGTYRIELAPFLLSPETHRRWRALIGETQSSSINA